MSDTAKGKTALEILIADRGEAAASKIVRDRLSTGPGCKWPSEEEATLLERTKHLDASHMRELVERDLLRLHRRDRP